jgi:hypothetical protein
MPLDSLEFAENPLLVKLGRVERLLATEQQWCKGRLRDVHGRHCLVGAIEAAHAWEELPTIILRASREVSGKRYWRIESFNDDPNTTHRDVLLVLRRARASIIAQMDGGFDSQPWYRRWAQKFGASGSASADRIDFGGEPKLAAGVQCVGAAAVMPEESSVS